MKGVSFMLRNKETGLSLLRSLPFLLTLGLFLSLMLTTIGSEARAEGSQSDTEEESLPEYSITLSDSQSSSSCSSVAFSGNTVTITEAGLYPIVFYWRNDYSSGSNPPAAIDNITIKKTSQDDQQRQFYADR